MVTETLQYFVLFCRSDYHAILVKCLIINDLRLIRTILFFIAFLNITYTARHTWATTAYHCEIHPGIISEAMGALVNNSDRNISQAFSKQEN